MRTSRRIVLGFCAICAVNLALSQLISVQQWLAELLVLALSSLMAMVLVGLKSLPAQKQSAAARVEVNLLEIRKLMAPVVTVQTGADLGRHRPQIEVYRIPSPDSSSTPSGSGPPPPADECPAIQPAVPSQHTDPAACCRNITIYVSPDADLAQMAARPDDDKKRQRPITGAALPNP
jgi:Zn-dependent protease with chaperone function